MKLEKATFAAGCFWHVQEEFDKIRGVVSTIVGYTGGNKENPSYEDVISKKTGHAEAIQITYDPSIVTYEKLLDVFWKIHDPTQLNRQGPDVGTNYRSAIFYHDKKQKESAEKSMKKQSEKIKGIVTEITPVSKFYSAEDYHQKYNEKRGRSCSI